MQQYIYLNSIHEFFWEEQHHKFVHTLIKLRFIKEIKKYLFLGIMRVPAGTHTGVRFPKNKFHIKGTWVY